MISDYPVFGVGVGLYRSQFKRYTIYKKADVSFAHNLILQVAAEFGLVGLALFLGFIVIVLYMGLALARTGEILFQGMFAVVIGVLVHMQFDNTIWGLEIGGVFWLIFGIIMGIYGLKHQCLERKA